MLQSSTVFLCLFISTMFSPAGENISNFLPSKLSGVNAIKMLHWFVDLFRT